MGRRFAGAAARGAPGALNLYIDSSVVLRIVFGEADPLPSWHRMRQAVSSQLLRVECLRTIDRARMKLRLADDEVTSLREEALGLLEGIGTIPLSAAILDRAADPFPTLIGSLDAIHLASALIARDLTDDLVFATHDHELALAARAVGFTVEGA